MKSYYNFDVIVVGGGHAGVEAAAAAGRMNQKTLLISDNLDTLGQMSCNPAIGGIGKGQLVREIDAMDGVIGVAADLSGIQFRTLNSSKGAAVRSTRAQIDRILYRKSIAKILKKQPNISFFQEKVEDLIINHDKVVGIITQQGIKFHTKSVIIATGTFLNGKIHIGMKNFSAGRAAEKSSIALAEKLYGLDLPRGRLKTGTPPRIDIKSIDFTKMQIQEGDAETPYFSFLKEQDDSAIKHPKQLNCHIAYTNEKTHEIIKQGLVDSPLYSEYKTINSTGPRYCPSIEDKIMRFSDKDRHQIFIEPEGLHSGEIYPNGISTSLDEDTQIKLIHSIPGMEKAFITRLGYAIEYDFFDPRHLQNNLETQSIKGLYFAGQINGTTGYEEAAAQGLVAGINAALENQEKEPWIPKRNDSYIGVMIDDLHTLGTTEPYRMFTSRAEYRIILREDNADERLTSLGHELGAVSDKRLCVLEKKQKLVAGICAQLKQEYIYPEHANSKKLPIILSKEVSLFDLLKRPEFKINHITDHKLYEFNFPIKTNSYLQKIIKNKIEILSKYEGYIKRQDLEITKLKKSENLSLDGIDYDSILGLSNEVKEKLNLFKPGTIGAASRISGITPASISLLLVHLKKHKIAKQKNLQSNLG